MRAYMYAYMCKHAYGQAHKHVYFPLKNRNNVFGKYAFADGTLLLASMFVNVVEFYL